MHSGNASQQYKASLCSALHGLSMTSTVHEVNHGCSGQIIFQCLTELITITNLLIPFNFPKSLMNTQKAYQLTDIVQPLDDLVVDKNTTKSTNLVQDQLPIKPYREVCAGCVDQELLDA